MINRILHLIPTLGRGGAENTLLNLIANDSEFEHRVWPWLSIPRLNPSSATTTLERSSETRPLSALVHVPVGLRRLLKKEPPLVVHCWLYHSAAMASIIANLGIQHHVLSWGIRHGEINSTLSNMSRISLRLMCSRISVSPVGIAYVSHRARTIHQKFWPRPPIEAVIWNGLPKSIFQSNPHDSHQFRARLDISEQARICLAVGRNHPQKNYAGLIEAFLASTAKYPQGSAVLIIVGRDAPKLETLARDRGLDPRNYRFIDEVQEVSPFYDCADMFVMCSLDGEGFPNALAEAMGHGLPVIATDTGDAHAMVGSDAGIAIPRADQSRLCDAVSELLTTSESQLREIGSAAKQRAKSEFAMATMIESYDEYFHSIIAGSR